MFVLRAENLSKRFGRRTVLSDISFEVAAGGSLAIVGPNGSGKTTLLLLLLGQYHPTRGKVTFLEDDRPMEMESVRGRTALVAPYLNLYDHLTAEENLVFFSTVAGRPAGGRRINDLLQRVGLEGRGHDQVRAYSSGMKQRLKYAVALMKEPDFLFVDEPTSNLDEAGKRMVFDLLSTYRKRAVVVIATNEPEEQQLADQLCRVA